MTRTKTRSKKVSFTATKKAPKKVRVSFSTRSGKRVSFKATKKVPIEADESQGSGVNIAT